KPLKKITSFFFNYKNKILEQKILGIEFKNPIGLAAGFDYEAQLTQILPEVGFGFHTVGSITLGKYEGNPSPQLARLPKSRSLLVNKGLKSTGTKSVLKNLRKKKFKIPLGISIAKTNCKTNSTEKEAIEDYAESLNLAKKSKIGHYYELNISCPNTFGGEPFTTPKKLSALLKRIDSLNLEKPLFLKMPVDFSTSQTSALCEIAKKHKVQGLIFGNLTKDRKNPLLNKEEVGKMGKGNFSGNPTKDRSNNLIKFAYKKYSKRFVIIGCGGVFTAQDAYEKIKLGASLIQLITGMIYNGPGTISEINSGLTRLLKKDGYKNISEVIGANNK
ncbi:MAG: quinone-dependent dihydroorotate dehydrogenase, partial [Nanoarchaeota archaeon]|nr:quinone-dependent dihydroorotate dehydrogenase [Nanoarchaeota archaeon]